MSHPAEGLRVAIVTTFYPPYHFGGDGAAIRRLVHALARRNHEVEVIHDIDAYTTLAGHAPVAPLLEPNGVRVHGLRSTLGSLSSLATQQLGRPLVHGRTIRRILDRGFDVIHYNNISLVGGPEILSYGSGIKLYTAHEHWLVCPTHVLWRHNRELCTSRECLRCVLHYGRPPQLWRATGHLQRHTQHVDEFLTLSAFAKRKHAEFGFDRPMTVAPAFLPDADAGTAEASSARARSAPGYFLFVGRLEEIKGLQDVIPRFAGERGAELWIAGAGAFEDDLRRLAAATPRVRFLGKLTGSELLPLYRNAIAVVVPSVCYEVFPMVVLEAFREATPVIARALGPFPEIIQQSRGGLLFSTDAELDEAMALLSADDQQRDRMGQSGYHAFQTYWRESVAMDWYFDLISRVAERRGLTSVLDRSRRAVGARP